jgi:hypothetical protein
MNAHEMHAREVHAREVHAREIHAHETHAYEIHALEMHAHKMCAREMHAHEVHGREIHAHEIHAHEMCAREMHAYEIHTHEVHIRKVLGEISRSLAVVDLSRSELQNTSFCAKEIKVPIGRRTNGPKYPSGPPYYCNHRSPTLPFLQKRRQQSQQPRNSAFIRGCVCI